MSASENMFTQFTPDYDALTPHIIPGYEAMQAAVMACVASARAPKSVLDIGCGTGNTLVRIHAAYPQAALRGVDGSAVMLDKAKAKLVSHAAVQWVEADIREADLGAQVDVAVSVAALNNIETHFLAPIYQKIYAALAEGGMFVHADFIAHESPVVQQQLDALYASHVRAGIADQAFLAHWFDAYANAFYPATLSQHFALLTEAGFKDITLHWLFESRAVFSARK